MIISGSSISIFRRVSHSGQFSVLSCQLSENFANYGFAHCFSLSTVHWKLLTVKHAKIRRIFMTIAAPSKFTRLRNRVFSKMWIGNFLWKIVRAVLIFGLCFFIIYPFFAAFIDTFKSVEDLYNIHIRYIPQQFTMEHFDRIVAGMDYMRTLIYTTLFCGAVAFIQMFICAAIAYGFARFKFPGRGILFGLVILVLLLPPQTIILSLFAQFRFFLGGFNLINTPYPMLILAATGLGIKNGLYVFMYRQYFRNLPIELEEAAYIDGCGVLQTFFRIVIPSSVAVMVTVFILSFSWMWTDSVYTGIFAGGIDLMVNKVALEMVVHRPVITSMLHNSSALLAVLPLAGFYLVAQNFLLQGIERSGITG